MMMEKLFYFVPSQYCNLFCSLEILISFPRNSISFPRNSISFPHNKENNLQMSLWGIKLEPQRGHGGNNYTLFCSLAIILRSLAIITVRAPCNVPFVYPTPLS